MLAVILAGIGGFVIGIVAGVVFLAFLVAKATILPW